MSACTHTLDLKKHTNLLAFNPHKYSTISMHTITIHHANSQEKKRFGSIEFIENGGRQVFAEKRVEKHESCQESESCAHQHSGGDRAAQQTQRRRGSGGWADADEDCGEEGRTEASSRGDQRRPRQLRSKRAGVDHRGGTFVVGAAAEFVAAEADSEGGGPS